MGHDHTWLLGVLVGLSALACSPSSSNSQQLAPDGADSSTSGATTQHEEPGSNGVDGSSGASTTSGETPQTTGEPQPTTGEEEDPNCSPSAPGGIEVLGVYPNPRDLDGSSDASGRVMVTVVDQAGGLILLEPAAGEAAVVAVGAQAVAMHLNHEHLDIVYYRAEDGRVLHARDPLEGELHLPVSQYVVLYDLALAGTWSSGALHAVTSGMHNGAMAAAYDGQAPWLAESLPVGVAGEFLAIATDDVQRVHALVAGYDEIQYVFRPAGGTWTISVITGGFHGQGGQSGDLNIEVDPTGTQHIAYRIDTDHLYYGFFDAQWQIEEVARGTEVTLMVDESGRPHLVYYFGGGLFYATRTEDGWEHTNIDTATGVGARPALVHDATGGLAVVYADENSGEIRLQRGVWCD